MIAVIILLVILVAIAVFIVLFLMSPLGRLVVRLVRFLIAVAPHLSELKPALRNAAAMCGRAANAAYDASIFLASGGRFVRGAGEKLNQLSVEAMQFNTASAFTALEPILGPIAATFDRALRFVKDEASHVTEFSPAGAKLLNATAPSFILPALTEPPVTGVLPPPPAPPAPPDAATALDASAERMRTMGDQLRLLHDLLGAGADVLPGP